MKSSLSGILKLKWVYFLHDAGEPKGSSNLLTYIFQLENIFLIHFWG